MSRAQSLLSELAASGARPRRVDAMPPRFSWWELRGHVPGSETAHEAAPGPMPAAETVRPVSKELCKMASPSAVADRLKALKAKIQAESDKLLSEIDGVENQKVPEAFAKGRAFLEIQHGEVKALEDELSQLTNLPLDPDPATASPDSKPTQ